MSVDAPLIHLVDDDPSLSRIVSTYLARENVRVEVSENGHDAIESFKSRVPDVLLLDLKLPDMTGFDVLENVERYTEDENMEVVVITGNGSMSVAVEAMQRGARDFLVKPFTKERLMATLSNVLEHKELKVKVQKFEKEFSRDGYCGFIGSSLTMQSVYRTIDNAAASKATVFITGESGTGKEVCAEAIHQKSDRAGKPFIAVNCGAIPKDLMESEIFGHKKGSFTGAHRDREGAALSANGGTLFLDEICEMDLAMQPKLLRFLQTGTVQAVGSDKLHTVDVRIICATNRNPMEEVEAGRFREDLFYRLHVLPMQLPPLRARENDIIEIARYFLERYATEENKVFDGFTHDVEQIFKSFPWPGNVRQLQNVIRNIVVLNQGDVITPDMLPEPLGSTSPRPVQMPIQQPMQSMAPAAETANPMGYGEPGGNAMFIEPRSEQEIPSMEQIERHAIQTALRLCGGSVPKASHYLGISAATIYRKKAAW